MQVRKIVAVSALTLCVGGAVADIAVTLSSSVPAPLAGVTDVFRNPASDHLVVNQALPDAQSTDREVGASLVSAPRTGPAIASADPLADSSAEATVPDRSDTALSDTALSDTATGTAVGLVAGILVGGLVGFLFGTLTGVVLMLFTGAGVAAIPLVSMAFGSNALGDSVAGGLVGAAVGGIIGLLGVTAPAATAAVVGHFTGGGRQR